MSIRESEWIRPEWLNRSVVEVAPELVGCHLVRQLPNGQVRRAMIVETEAYEAGDPACHAYQRKTKRNAPMFGPAGRAYVYLIYGIYHCFNIVTDRDGLASAVLVRALTPPPLPEDFAATLKGKPIKFAAGPGKLCRVMEIDRSLSGVQLHPVSGLWLEPRSPQFQQSLEQGDETLVQTTRIGISKGVEYPWRWYLENSPSVSIKVKNQNA